MAGFFSKGRKPTTQSPSEPNKFNEVIFQHSFQNIPIPSIIHNSKQYVDAIKTNPPLYTVTNWKASKSSQIKPLILQDKPENKSDKKEFHKWNGIYTNPYELRQLKKLRTKAFEDMPMDEIGVKSDLVSLKKILTRPNEYQTWAGFMYASSMYKDNGWIALYGTRLEKSLNSGRFHNLYNLPTHLVEIVASGNPVDPILGYRYRSNPNVTILKEDVIRISSESPELDMNGGHLYGVSKIQAVWPLIKAYTQAIEREYSSFAGGDLRALITPKDGDNPIPNDESGIFQKFRDSIVRSLRQKTSQLMAVIGSPIEVTQLQSNLIRGVTSDAKKEAKEDISALWNFNAQVIFPSSGGTTYDNQRSYIASCLRDGVFPDLIAIEEHLREYVIQNYQGYSIAFDYDVYEELGRDLAKEVEMLSKADFMSDNEKRLYIDYEALQDERAELPQKYWDISIPDPLPLDE